MDYLTEAQAVNILDECEAIKVNDIPLFRNMKVHYEQKLGFYVKGGCNSITNNTLSKIIRIAENNNAILIITGSDSVQFFFSGDGKKVG